MQGEKVGSKAHVTELRRENSGEFDVADAWQLESLIDLSKEMGMGRPPRQRQQQRKKKKQEQEPQTEDANVGSQDPPTHAANAFREL